jgi:thiol-disulfide isomerase/thioredoxin
VQTKKGKRFVRVNDFQVIEASAGTQAGRKALGTAPDLSLTDLSGIEQTLRSRRGRIVVLNFWGTFCLPCVQEMPDLAAIQAEYAAMGVEVIGAAADAIEDRPKVLSFVKKYRINFPIWLAASAEDMRRFGVGEALPATVVIDREGKIVWQKRGVTSKEELSKQIDGLLAKTASAPAISSEPRKETARQKADSPAVSRVPS